MADGLDPSLLGVVISHPHADHYGLLAKVGATVPVYIGEAASRILSEAAFFTPLGIDRQPCGYLRHRQAFDVGPFRVTPFLNDLERARCIWSMWPGYLREPSGERLRAWLDGLGIQMLIHHASGHAFIPDLQRVVRALVPARVVPIHSFAAERFENFFPRVERRRDGEWWEV